MRPIRTLPLLGMAALLLSVPLWAGPDESRTIAMLIARLDDTDWSVREGAHQELLRRAVEGGEDEAVLAALDTVPETASPEVRDRTARLIDAIRTAPRVRIKGMLQTEAFGRIREAWPALVGALVRDEPLPEETITAWGLDRANDCWDGGLLELATLGDPVALTDAEILERWTETVLDRLEVIHFHQQREAIRQQLEEVARRARLRNSWTDLMEEAYVAGRLRGQAFEDLYFFLFGGTCGIDKVVPIDRFGNEADCRVAFALLLELVEERNAPEAPVIDTWEEGIAQIARRECFRTLHGWIREWEAGRIPRDYSVVETLLEHVRPMFPDLLLEDAPAVSVELALYAALTDVVSLTRTVGPLPDEKPIRWERNEEGDRDANWEGDPLAEALARRAREPGALDAEAERRAYTILSAIVPNSSLHRVELQIGRGAWWNTHGRWFHQGARIAGEREPEDLAADLFLALVR